VYGRDVRVATDREASPPSTASITLRLGCVRVLFAWGRTVLLLSLGYCEGEFIADGR